MCVDAAEFLRQQARASGGSGSLLAAASALIKEKERRCSEAAQATLHTLRFALGGGPNGDFVRIFLAPGADAADASEFNSAGDSASESTGFDAREHEPLHVLQACS